MLFISHAGHDLPLVEAFVTLLESGVGVPHKDIICTSLKGQSVRPGKKFDEAIRESLDQATCVVALISEAYYASAFCMCELGGVWLQAKSFLPFLVPPLGFPELKAVLVGLQVSKLSVSGDLDELRDELKVRLGIEGHKTPRWNSERAKFLKSLKRKTPKFEGPVAYATHATLKGELAAYEEEYNKLDERLARKTKMLADVMKTKDAVSAAAVVREYSTEVEVFERLVKAAASAIAGLSSPTKEALYQQCRGSYYSPKTHEWDDATDAIEDGEVLLNPDEDGVTPNSDNRRVQNAEQAVQELSSWLDDATTENFLEWYAQDTDGEQLKIELRPFWRRHF